MLYFTKKILEKKNVLSCIDKNNFIFQIEFVLRITNFSILKL